MSGAGGTLAIGEALGDRIVANGVLSRSLASIRLNNGIISYLKHRIA